MSFRPKNHYIAHPCLAIRPDGFVQLTAIDPHLIIHPAQLLKFLDYDNDVRRRSVTVNDAEPAGYEAFAQAYNTTKGDNPCEFITRIASTGEWNYDSFPVPRSIITFPNLDPRYAELRAFGILNEKGNIDAGSWASMKNALLRPHREAVRNQARSQTRREERELKRRRFEDANPHGIILPTYPTRRTSTQAGPSTANTSDSLADLDEMTLDAAFLEAVSEI